MDRAHNGPASSSHVKSLWRVWARITGPALPTSPVQIGRALVGPVSGKYRPPEPPPPPVNGPVGSTYFVARGAELEVTSECWVLVHGVEADRDDRAIEQVADGVIPNLLAALSAGYAEYPYRIEMVGADNGVEGFGYSAVSSMAFFDVAELSPQRAAEADARSRAISGHPDLVLAADLLARGLQYLDLGAVRLSHAAAVLSFYQVLEACSRVVPWDRPDTFDGDCNRVISELESALKAKKTRQKRVTAVKHAAVALDRLDAKYTSLRIEHAANTFGLGKGWLNRARALGKFRNAHLGHANELPSWEQLQEWTRVEAEATTSAFAIASSMLAGAIIYVQGSP